MSLKDFFANISDTLKRWSAEGEEILRQKEMQIQENINISGQQFINGYGEKFHCQDEQYVRFQRAISSNNIGKVVSLNRKKMLMDILSTKDYRKTYKVSLTRCECEDFKKRYLPCKHMYKLALELGIISTDWDISGIPYELRKSIDSLLYTDKVKLLTLLANYKSYGLIEVKRREITENLIDSGFVIEPNDRADLYEILDKNYNKSDLFVALTAAKNSYTPNSRATKKEMILWILNNDEKLLNKLLKKHYYIRLRSDLLDCRIYILRQYKDYLE